MGAFEKLGTAAFEEYVEDGGQRCLVLFTRASCPVCQSVRAKLEALRGDYPDLPFYEVDAERQPQLMARFRLKGVPQTLLFADGEPRDRITGDAGEDELADRIEAL